MIGPTLVDIRSHIEALASDGGRYHVLCTRTGECPIPASGKRFDDRTTARAAAHATEQYRAALRRYDPQVPYRDLIVCEEPPPTVTTGCCDRGSATCPSTPSEPVLASRVPTRERRDVVEFCHRAAGVVFETLSDGGYGGVRMAAMDTYLELSETTDDPDGLCLCLLESMAVELCDRLKPADQADVIATAAARLDPVRETAEPLAAALAALENRGLIETYETSPQPIERAGSAGAKTVRLFGYALSPQDGRLPVLPLTLELSRHTPGWLLDSLSVSPLEDGWRLTFRPDGSTSQRGVVNAPIEEEA